MIREWLNYLWVFAFSFFYHNSPRQIMGDGDKLSFVVVVGCIAWDFFTRRTNAIDEEVPNNNQTEESSLELVSPSPSNTEEMALVKTGDSTVREEEVEETTETTLSERTKDTGNTQMMEKAASFHGEQTSKVVEETGFSTQNVECDAKNELETDIATRPVPQASPQKQQLPDIYRPLEPVKRFEPLQPFAPLSQIEAPRSFELAKQIEANIQSEYARNNVITQEASSGETPLSIDSTQTNNLNVNNDVNTLDDDVRQFEPIKPLELPEHVNNVSKQYEPLEPFEVGNGSENIENIQLEQSQDVKSITNVNNLEENVAPNVQLLGDTVETEQVQSQDVSESSIAPVEPFELRTSTGELYIPVVALEPLNLDDYLKPIVVDRSQNNQAEIKQDSIKESLKEIISDLDMYAEKDKELKESLMNDEGREKNLERQKQCSSRNSQEMLVVRLPSCVSPNRQRPLSLPPENLLSLIKCAQIAQELNKVIQSNGNHDQDENAAPKPFISLEKLFTPAEDAPQILPSTSKKVYASSSFYAKGLHPTMEEQVELAKRISNSLSDISNKTSKGQSMYVNRKKRSVKWVHEGEGEDAGKQNGAPTEICGKKSPLKLLMNPHGQIQDITSLRRQGYDIEAALSPDVCLEIVKDLNAPKGKGAELFAKRRKRSEKWVVGETNGVKQDNLPDIAAPPLTPHTPVPPAQTNLPTPGYIPETTQRMQHHQKLDEIQEKFTRPRVKLIKSPWDAALETGSVDAAFENVAPIFPPPRGSYVAPVVDSYEQALKTDSLADWRVSPSNGYNDKVYAHNPAYNSNSINRIVDNLQKGVGSVDVYKPKFPQAWNSKPTNQQYYSNTLPRSKPKVTPPSPSPNYKGATVTPTVFISKESPVSQPSFPTQPTYSQQEPYTYSPSPSTPKVDLRDFQNYNTAPRGWGQTKNVYRPITFDKPRSSYTDF